MVDYKGKDQHVQWQENVAEPEMTKLIQNVRPPARGSPIAAKRQIEQKAFALPIS
jgi:hypothetical protein